MKYLVLTMDADIDVAELPNLQAELETLMPGVKTVIIAGATSATLIETDEEEK